jgi:hypothetical protein
VSGTHIGAKHVGWMMCRTMYGRGDPELWSSPNLAVTSASSKGSLAAAIQVKDAICLRRTN